MSEETTGSGIRLHVETVDELTVEGADFIVTDAIPGDVFDHPIRAKLHLRAKPTKFFYNLGMMSEALPVREYYWFEMRRGGERLEPRTLIPINPGFYDDAIVHIEIYKKFPEGRYLDMRLTIHDESELEESKHDPVEAGP